MRVPDLTRPCPAIATLPRRTAPQLESNFCGARCTRIEERAALRRCNFEGLAGQMSSTQSRGGFLPRKGRRGRGKAASCAPSEPHQHLHMKRLWKNVKYIYAFDLVRAGIIRANQLGQVPAQRGRIAGYIV